jgi:hypothetical protein
MISGTNIILNLGGRGTPADAYNVWAVDINGAGAVGLRGIVSNASRAVALDGRLYWITTSGSSAQLISCPQANCTAANFVTVATRDGGSGNSIAAPLLVADPSTHELVWQEYVYTNGVYTYSVVRSGPQGPARALTSFASATFLGWSVPNNRPDRFFWYTIDSSYTQETVYYLPTNTASASAIALTGPMTVSITNVLANDTTAYLSTGISSPYQMLAIPLPNGVVGTPPSVFSGATWAAVDGQYAYGQYTGTAYDGVWRCSLANCNPTYLARGFLDSGGTYFLVDDTAIYLLDRPSGGASFKVWKLAK